MRVEPFSMMSWIPITLLLAGSAAAGPLPPAAGGTPPAAEGVERPVSSADAVGSGVVSGFDHSCRLMESGGVLCWGANDQGQLGDGTNEPRSEPVEVAGGLSMTALSAGHKRTCGIADGRIYCWGMQTGRAPGEPAGPPNLEPTPLRSDQRFTSVSVGTQHACALAQNGSAHCWGRNRAGELGD